MGIDKLTIEQSQLLKDKCKQWRELSSVKDIDRKKFESAINWVYCNLLKRGNPKIIYCDSWLSCSLIMQIVRNQFRGFGGEVGVLEEVDHLLRDAIHSSIRNPARNVILNNVSGAVRNKVRQTITELLGDKIGASSDDFELETNLDAGWDAFFSNAAAQRTDTIIVQKFKNHLLQSVADCNLNTHPFSFIREGLIAEVKNYDIATISGFGSAKNNYLLSSNKGIQFCAYYDFFEELGVPMNHAFKVYRSLIQSGVFQVYEFDGIVYAIQPPVSIDRNENGQLDSVERPAIEFRDSSGYYFINGRWMPKRIFLYPFDRNALINEPDEDVKAGMMHIITTRDGSQGLLDFLGAEVVDQKEITHFHGYTEIITLYKTRETFEFLQNRLGERDQPYCWSGFKCPSTGTEYLIDNSADFTCALEAMKFLRPTFVPEELTYLWSHSAN